MVNFVLVSAPRSGTNLLRGTIGFHPRARLIGEIFYEDPATWGLHDELGSEQSRVDEARALKASDPIRFLEAYGFAAGQRAAAASGFTLMYDQPGDGSRSVVLNWIASQGDIRILHLRRRNELRRYLSLHRAMASGEWVRCEGQGAPARPIRVDPGHFLQATVQLQQQRRDMMALLAGHAILELEYEELSASLQSELDRIQDFLGLDRLTLRPRTVRQGTDDLRASIENYDELHDRLAGTVAAEWLVSDSGGS